MQSRFTDEVPVLKISALVRAHRADLRATVAGATGIVDLEWGPAANRRLQKVPVVTEPCRFGGCRFYFKCPVASCGRKVTRLYRLNRSFRCRHCQGLKYRTQHLQRLDRLVAKRTKLARRLGGRPFYIPERPPGMWRSTYERLIGQLNAIERELDNAVFLILKASMPAN